MISRRVLHSLSKRTGKTEDDIKQILDDIIKTIDFNLYNIYFIQFPFFQGSGLNANSGFRKTIFLSEDWAYYLIKNDKDIIKQSFLMTIGHEHGHRQEHINRIWNIRFLNQKIEKFWTRSYYIIKSVTFI